MKPLFIVILTIFLPVFGQQSLDIQFWEARIEHSPVDPCKFKFIVHTMAVGSGTVTATAHGSFSLSGTSGSLSGSLSAEATGQGRAEAKEQRTFSFPAFGKLSGQANGTHTATDANTSATHEFVNFVSEMECELFAHNLPDPCEHLPAKQLNNDPCNVSPIVLDLDKNGFSFGGPATAVHFDIYGSGSPILMHWVVPNENDAFLVYDANRNGLVDDGSELFGNGSRMILQNNQLAPNGFVALGQHDLPELGGNNDGFIDPRDAIWSQLYLWLDQDADGTSTYDEMIALNELDLQHLETIPRDLHQFDQWGNWLPYWATALATGGPIDMVDVFFRIVQPLESKQR